MKQANATLPGNILKNLKKGNQQAFRTIYDLYKDRLYYFLLRFCKNSHDAEELLQMLFVKLWENRKKIKQDTSFDAYLFTIAKNLAFDFLKSRTHQQLQSLHEQASEYAAVNVTEEKLLFEEYQLIALQAIEALPEKRQIIYRMNHEEGLAVNQIAEMLGLSPNTVKVQLSKATQSVRKFVRERGELAYLFLLMLQ
jgi:RNA polymerase sigma-70 factor (ECF subfamily)